VGPADVRIVFGGRDPAGQLPGAPYGPEEPWDCLRGRVAI